MAMEVPILRRCQPRVVGGIMLMLLAGVLGGFMFNVLDFRSISRKGLGILLADDATPGITLDSVLKIKHEAKKHFHGLMPPQSSKATPVKIKIVEKVVEKVVKKVVYKTAGPPRVLYRFWGQFLLWDSYKRPAYGPDVPEGTDKYFIYRCDGVKMGVCGGWADRIKGMVISYLLANLTGRSFKIQISSPDCKMTNYVLPNRVNWSLPKKEMPKNNKTWSIYRHIDDHGFKWSIHRKNFSEEFDRNLKIVFFIANLENVSGLKRNKRYASQLSWMKGLTSADVYAAIYKRLFVLHPRIQTQVQKIMFDILKTPKHRLICVHIRMGRTKTIEYDTEIRNNMTNLPKVYHFIHEQSKSEYDQVYVMSDSQAVIDDVRYQKFKGKLVTIPGQIVHVDKQYYKETHEMCDGFEKLLLEHHILMNCDVLVRGHSGLSVMASAIRGTDKDLYCLRRNGDIEPCVRNEFSTFL